MALPVMINGIVCFLGTLIGVLVAGASIISIANMTVAWRTWLLFAAPLIPLMFVVSGIGTALAYGHMSQVIVITLIALPWLYSGGFVLVMLMSFG